MRGNVRAVPLAGSCAGPTGRARFGGRVGVRFVVAEVRFHFMTCGQDYYDMFTDRSLHTGIEMGRRASYRRG